MIEVHNLTKRYSSSTAVNALSYTAPEGAVTGFLGPNGSGTVSYTHVTLPTKRIV